LDAEAPIFKTRTSWNNALNSVERIEQFFGQRRPKQSEASQGLGTNAASTPQRWRLGSRVRHPKYGLGTVVDCEGEGQDAKVTVSFPGYGKKKLVERYASLTRA
jgi:DNA helicase-2/ATP-dependent DNA helicase PcrA